MPWMKLIQGPSRRLGKALNNSAHFPRIGPRKAGPIWDPGNRWGGGRSPELAINLQLVLHYTMG
eukprot:8365745-Pyramimonas_sp.AAC.1